jgi:hypothetical protein
MSVGASMHRSGSKSTCFSTHPTQLTQGGMCYASSRLFVDTCFSLSFFWALMCTEFVCLSRFLPEQHLLNVSRGARGRIRGFWYVYVAHNTCCWPSLLLSTMVSYSHDELPRSCLSCFCLSFFLSSSCCLTYIYSHWWYYPTALHIRCRARTDSWFGVSRGVRLPHGGYEIGRCPSQARGC